MEQPDLPPSDLPPAGPCEGPDKGGDDGSDIRRRLMQVGLHEFAHFGLQGARLDRVAAEAGCAKRMVYYYFGNKEGYYIAVLRAAYADIRQSEADLDLEAMDPVQALHLLARHSFDYHDSHPDFTRLVLVENLQGGRMMGQIGAEAGRLRAAAMEPLARLLARGVAAGRFRPGTCAAEVHYLISAHSCYRVDHARTWEVLLKVDLLSPHSRDLHLRMMLAAVDLHVGLTPS